MNFPRPKKYDGFIFSSGIVCTAFLKSISDPSAERSSPGRIKKKPLTNQGLNLLDGTEDRNRTGTPGGHRFLRPTCLPIPPLRHELDDYIDQNLFVKSLSAAEVF